MGVVAEKYGTMKGDGGLGTSESICVKIMEGYYEGVGRFYWKFAVGDGSKVSFESTSGVERMT